MSTKTSRMKQGDAYTVRSGEFKGKTATVVDPKPFPDDDLTRRRKITVEVDGDIVYMLPRMLETSIHSNVVPLQQYSQDHTVAIPSPQGPVLIPGDITDVDDPRLDPWRPDPAIVRQYISRKVPSGQTDIEFLTSFYERRENVMLVGETQSGKTMLVQVLAVVLGQKRPSRKPLPVFTLSGSSGVTDFDMFGQPVAYADPSGMERLVNLPGVVDLAVRVGAMLYLDEASMISERFTASLHSVCDHRRAFVNRQKAVRFVQDDAEVFMPEVVEAAESLWVIATVNPVSYKGNSMNEAFLNRFTCIPWDYDEAVEKKLVPSAAIRLLGQSLREARHQRALNTPIGTAALARACSHVTEYGVDTALWMVVAMFNPQERAKVEAIIEDRSIRVLLLDEAKAKATEPTV
jgi:energy-coupling factor transporter ATP-binding protein EcfA2